MNTLASRTVTGVVAAMVAATALATTAGFWLSYAALHDFAIRAGLHSAEAWAWPASVDLFILAGEAGVTLAALRRARDRGAWAYLALGFAASVTANVLHVDPGALHWARYAVAAVPPVAAMAALAALLRQAYKLAVPGVPGEPDAVPERHQDGFADGERAAGVFAAELTAGRIPSIRAIKSGLSVGQPKAREVRAYLTSLAAPGGGIHG